MENEDSVWSIALQPDENRQNQFWDMGYNGLSGDEIAEMRARYLLLGEKPRAREATERDVLRFHTTGFNSSGTALDPIFPQLWKKYSGDLESFLPLGRLWALFHLKASGICEHVLKLELRPTGDSQIQVSFKGRRRHLYSNQEPCELIVEGKSKLR